MALRDGHQELRSAPRRATVDRSGDRLIALAGIGLGLGFLGASGASLLLPPDTRHGLWLPLHLALAGGATSAIAGVVPFFVAALAAGPPASALLRASGLGAVALGAAGVSIAVPASIDPVAVAGGMMFVAGLLMIGMTVGGSVHRGLGPSSGLVAFADLFGLACVTTGASLASLYLAGWGPLVGGWEQILPAHAWLNLFGFVSLVIATTMLHLFPTVVGSRIIIDRWAWVAGLSLAAGAVLNAAGYLLNADVAVWVGSTSMVLGTLVFACCIVAVWRRRARWRTDPGWHCFAMGSLVSAVAWFIVGVAIASVSAAWHGSSPAGWSLRAVAGPVLVGWIGLSLIGSATHLVPAVGPGHAVAHGRQRMILGAVAMTRLVMLNFAIAGLTIAVPLHISALTVAAAVVAAGGFLVSAGLLVRAIEIGLRW